MAPSGKKGRNTRQSSSSGSNTTETAAAEPPDPCEAAGGSGKSSADQRRMQQPSITEALAGRTKTSKSNSGAVADRNSKSSKTLNRNSDTATQNLKDDPILLDAVSKLRGRAEFDHFVAFFANKFHCKYFQRPKPTS